MIRILALSFALLFSTAMSAYAGFTSPANGISTTGNYTVSWQGNPVTYSMPPGGTEGIPLYKLTEQKLNSGVAPVLIPSQPDWTSSSASFSGKTPGHYVYTYSERRCTVSGCTYFTPPDGQLIVSVGSDARVISEPTELATAVGATAYSATVNNKGEAVIAVPINLPEGAAGMHPQLSLNFNSSGLEGGKYNQVPSGWLGYGWGLSGISSISRCTMGNSDITVYNDPGDPSSGTTKMRPRLQYNDSDNLCIDGELLKLVSGTHLRVGAQYRTYNESFRLVTFKGTEASPWFEVRNPNGSVAVYGKENNSKIQKITTPGGSTKTPYFIWSIDSEKDTFGNDILYWYSIKDESFSYQPNKQRVYPDFIHYAGVSVSFNYRAVNAPVNTIGLIDDGASAGIDRYRFNHDSGRQLTKITVSPSEPEQAKTYKVYGTNQTEEQIKSNGLQPGSIQECVGIEETGVPACLPPLSFQWSLNGPNYFLFETITDSLGAVTKFEYYMIPGYDHNLSGNYTMPHPFAMPTTTLSNGKKGNTRVVQNLYRSNGLAADQFHRTLYNYYGIGEESNLGKGFFGFRAMAIHDMTNRVSTYRQFSTRTAHLTGSLDLVAEQVYGPYYTDPNAKLLSKVEYRPNIAEFTFSNGTKTYTPIVDQITNFSYEKGVLTGVSTKVNAYALDSTAKAISSITSTTTTGAAVNAISFTPSQWGDNAAYVVNPSTVKATHQKITTLASAANVTDWRIGYTTREENRFYNGVIGGSGVDSKTQWMDYTVKTGTTLVETATRFTNDLEYHLQTTYGYTYGLLTSTTVSGVNVDSRTTSMAYGGSVTVPASVTNAYNHTQTNSNFDRRFGLPRISTDENGLISTREYDVFGRVQTAMDVNGAITTQHFISCAASNCETVPGKLGPVAPVYFKEVISHIAPKAREYYDTRGRLIRSETEGFTAGEWIRNDVQYDELGRAFKTSLPYKAGASAEYVVKTYDNRSRVVSIQQPDGGLATTDYNTGVIVSGENWLKVTTDETVKKADGTVETAMAGRKVSYFNGAGQLVRVVDAQGSAQETTTSYEYDALGNTVKTTVSGGTTSISTAIYDKAGNRISLTDPNAGTVTSKYTALGQLRETTDAKGTVTTYTYDKLGRMLTRSNSIDGTHNWVYDAVGAKGLLSSTTNNNGYTQTYFYQDANRAARLSKIETAITVSGAPGAATKTFTETMNYDIYGRVSTTVTPAQLPTVGFTTRQTYNERKYPDILWRNTGIYPLRVINKMGALGVEEELLFNTKTTRTYDPKSGRTSSILTTYNSTKIQDFTYQWYTNGSLQTKTDNKTGTAVMDTFTYDAHDRLTNTATSVSGSTQRTQTQSYNKLGNVTANTSTNSSDAQVTAYQYSSGRPHAVSSAVINGVSTALAYDANGAITSYAATGTANDKYISYNSANQPTKITAGGSYPDDPNATARDEFKYTPDGARYYKKSTYWQAGVLRTEHTFYVGSYETTFYDTSSSIFQSEKVLKADVLFIRKTPYVGSVVETQQFLHRDQLGSVTAVTNGSAGGITQLAFESFGSRRNSATLTGNITLAQLDDLFTKRADLHSASYTGHESLDRTGFIHMNGRVYDPRLSRFLSPDPLVQAPTNSQSWNRYSYVFNNPLKYTDPSGYQAVEEVKVIGERGCGEKCQRENAETFAAAQYFMDAFTKAGMTTTASGEVNFKGQTFSAADANLLSKLMQTTITIDPKLANTVIGALSEAMVIATGKPLSLGGARRVAAALLPKNSAKEHGIIIYKNGQGHGLSTVIPGTKNVTPFAHQKTKNGVTRTAAGLYGVEGEFDIVEVIHSHPRGSSARFSGADIRGAEELNINTSLIYGNQLRLYTPQGLNRKHYEDQYGELVCKSCF